MYFETIVYQYKHYVIVDVYTPKKIKEHSSVYRDLYT